MWKCRGEGRYLNHVVVVVVLLLVVGVQDLSDAVQDDAVGDVHRRLIRRKVRVVGYEQTAEGTPRRPDRTTTTTTVVVVVVFATVDVTQVGKVVEVRRRQGPQEGRGGARRVLFVVDVGHNGTTWRQPPDRRIVVQVLVKELIDGSVVTTTTSSSSSSSSDAMMMMMIIRTLFCPKGGMRPCLFLFLLLLFFWVITVVVLEDDVVVVVVREMFLIRSGHGRRTLVGCDFLVMCLVFNDLSSWIDVVVVVVLLSLAVDVLLEPHGSKKGSFSFTKQYRRW
jgi:hypothetical protein